MDANSINYMEKLKNFIKSRGFGFYFVFAASVLSIIQTIVYNASYNVTNFQYYITNSFIRLLPLIAALAFIILSVISIFFKDVEEFSAPVYAILTFIGLLNYVKTSYKYFADISFGSSFTIDKLGLLDGAYAFCLYASIITLIISIAGIFIRQSKKENSDAKE